MGCPSSTVIAPPKTHASSPAPPCSRSRTREDRCSRKSPPCPAAAMPSPRARSRASPPGCCAGAPRRRRACRRRSSPSQAGSWVCTLAGFGARFGCIWGFGGGLILSIKYTRISGRGVTDFWGLHQGGQKSMLGVKRPMAHSTCSLAVSFERFKIT